MEGRDPPKLPILQPEKVTAIPLDIRLTEDYEYTLKGDTRVSGRPAYHVAFAPKGAEKEKPTFRGSVWIDKETFALLRRDSVQLNLKGETLSAVQTEYYKPVPGRPEIFLPLEIHGQEVYSTAGRTTAIERVVEAQTVVVDPPDFTTRRAEAYKSPSQMIRHTERGMRYLVPDPRIRGTASSRRSSPRRAPLVSSGPSTTTRSTIRCPLPGSSTSTSMSGKGKTALGLLRRRAADGQLQDPSLAGSHFDLGADLFGVALPLGDVSYRNGKEVPSEKIKHLPAHLNQRRASAGAVFEG